MSPRRAKRDLDTIQIELPSIDVSDVSPVRPADGGGPVAGGLVLLKPVTVEVHDPALPYRIALRIVARGGALACDAVTLACRPPGPPVTGTALRAVVIDSYVARVREELGRPGVGSLLLVKVRDQRADGIGWSGPTADESATFQGAQRRDHRAPTSERVAELYRRSLESPNRDENRAPTASVARSLHVHRGHAARLVARARREGHLGPARPGRSGEHTTPQGGGS